PPLPLPAKPAVVLAVPFRRDANSAASPSPPRGILHAGELNVPAIAPSRRGSRARGDGSGTGVSAALVFHPRRVRRYPPLEDRARFRGKVKSQGRRVDLVPPLEQQHREEHGYPDGVQEDHQRRVR
ncbi:unnamed protein product, partial [Ectocarpus sp. 8 AP-2014]